MTPTPGNWPVLTGALVELAGPLAAAERADVLAAVTATVLCDGATAVILAPDGEVEAAGGSDDGCRVLAGLDRPATGGPTHLCVRAGETVTVAPDGGPGWREAAREQGWSVAVAVPLLAGPTAVGGLVLLGRQGWEPSTVDLLWARTLGAVGAVGLLQARALAREHLVNCQLRQALDSRIVIEQAKGVLAERGGLDVSTAFDRMRRYSRARRTPLAEVALDVVEGDLADEVLTHVARPGNRPGGHGPPDGPQ